MFTVRRSNYRPLAGIVVGVATLFATACSGNSLTPATAPGISAPGATRGDAASREVAPATTFTFTTLDDQADPTFNQLLGINKKKVIAGYFGSGASPSHPNKGYILSPPYGQGNYTNTNFPGSTQTQVTAINDKHDTAGFWANAKGTDRGWIMWNGVFTSYTDPHTPKTGITTNQLLGINDAGIAVGFYNDATGKSHAYKLNQKTGVFTPLHPPAGTVGATASAINNIEDIVGFTGNMTVGFAGFLYKGGHYSALQFPGGSNTQPFGVNDRDQIVGSYLDSNGVMHGFLLSTPLTHAKWQSIDDPNGVGSTVVNGINDATDLVGFYTDTANNTDGMLATP